MKESLRETPISISPMYHSGDKEACVTTSRNACNQAPGETPAKGKRAGPWATDVILKGHLAGVGLPAGEKARPQQGWSGREEGGGGGGREEGRGGGGGAWGSECKPFLGLFTSAVGLIHCATKAEVSTKAAAGWKTIFKGPTSQGDEVLSTLVS